MQKNPSTNIFWLLALGGFIPFAALTGASVLKIETGLSYPPQTLFLFWSLAILSFLGGIRWGLAIAKVPADVLTASLSVVPCILGWFSLLMPASWTILCLGLLYFVHGWWDFSAFKNTDQEWFRPIRLVLTLLVVVAHLFVSWNHS